MISTFAAKIALELTEHFIYRINKMKKTITSLTLLLYLVNAYPCTIIIGFKNGKVLVGNNEDWYKSNAKYWFEKPKKKEEKYTAYFFGFQGDGKFAQGGMNEEGLMFDGTYVSKLGIDRDNMRAKKLKAAPVHLFKNILKTCKNIEEAKVIIDKYFIPYIRTAQVLIVDAKGGYLVVKANGVIEKGYLKEGEYKIVTNFHLEDLKNDNYTCYRYDIAKESFEQQFNNSVDEFENILFKTHQNYPVSTVYSNIYDLTEKKSYLYYNANFKKKITIDFNNEFFRKPKLLEEDIFEKRIIGNLIKIHRKDKLDGIKEFMKGKNGLSLKSSIIATINLSEYLYRREKTEDYFKIVEYLKANYSNQDKVNLAVGKYFLRKGRIKDALNNFKTELENDPDDYWSNRLYNIYNTENKCKEKFTLKGYENATSVILYGNFNEWRGYDNVCKLEKGVWTTCVNSNEKKLLYRFKVDDKWVELPRKAKFEKLSNGFKVLVKESL